MQIQGKVTAIALIQMLLPTMDSSLPNSLSPPILISKPITVLLRRVELNNNKWVFTSVVLNSKLHMWFHPVPIIASFFLTVKFLDLKLLDKFMAQTKVPLNINKMG
jgi:hypothetical protein